MAPPLQARDLNTGAAVGWRDGEDPDAVARRIRDAVPNVNVQIPSELSQLLRQSTAFFSALVFGIAALAFVIGGLSLANTVAASVFERLRDFGVNLMTLPPGGWSSQRHWHSDEDEFVYVLEGELKLVEDD